MPNLSELKNIHLGERCFLIGNGPSLNNYDLTRLIDEWTFVCNEFHVHPIWKRLKKVWYSHLSSESFNVDGYDIWKYRQLIRNTNAYFVFESKFKSIYDRINRFPSNRCYYIHINKSKQVMNGSYEWDITKGSIWSNTTVIESSLALAQYMGFKKMYLLGCDTTRYSGKMHFYDHNRIPMQYLPYKTDEHDNEFMLKSWNNIAEIFKGTDIDIYNASNEGRLNMFDRVNFGDIV